MSKAESRNQFTTAAERMLANHSGWSGVACATCGREMTIAQLAYSRRFYRKTLCRSCQRLEPISIKQNINP